MRLSVRHLVPSPIRKPTASPMSGQPMSAETRNAVPYALLVTKPQTKLSWARPVHSASAAAATVAISPPIAALGGDLVHEAHDREDRREAHRDREGEEQVLRRSCR